MNMPAFLSYTFKAALLTAVFYTFWRLLLSKETFHRLNRIVLVLTPVVSLLLPLCVITVHRTEYVSILTDLTSSSGAAPVAGTVTVPLWVQLLAAVYAAGVAMVIFKTIWSVVKLRRIIREGAHERLDDGADLVITDRDVAPFSWMSHIVLSRKDYESWNPEIVSHEQAHIAMRHSFDILLVDIFSAFQWYNPMVWMLRSDLRGVHEYEADEAVLEKGIDATQYQMFLIRKAAADRGYTVANSFNSGTLKNRITMMLKKRSKRLSAMKVLFVIPVIGLSLAATARTVTDYIPTGDDTQVQVPQNDKEPVPFRLVETKPTFNGGGADEFSKWVNENLKYPDDAKAEKVQGRVTLQFTVTETGEVKGVRILRGTGHTSLDEEAVRVIKASPKWTPGRNKDGQNVPVVYSFPVIFQLK